MKAPGPHEHFCPEHGHGHRWRCAVDPCTLHDATPCGEERCARCAALLVPVGDIRWECPFRWKEPGHDIRDVVPEGSLL